MMVIAKIRDGKTVVWKGTYPNKCCCCTNTGEMTIDYFYHNVHEQPLVVLDTYKDFYMWIEENNIRNYSITFEG